jgi:unsaturated rhamnogalacturonyl hydrolase
MFLQITALPSSDSVARALTSALRRQVDALVPLQDPESGLWRTLIDDPTSYIETSGTAGFVGGILMAIRMVSVLWRATANE